MEGVFLMSDIELINKVKKTLIIAGSTFSDDKVSAYKRAIEEEKNDRAKWVLETILENAKVAVLYAVAYMYEHREQADHNELALSLRSLLFSAHEGGF